MTRKDYIKAAEQVRFSDGTPALKDYLVKHFVSFFKADNAAFDETRFRVACLYRLAPDGKAIWKAAIKS
jgi:hypothetical protein